MHVSGGPGCAEIHLLCIRWHRHPGLAGKGGIFRQGSEELSLSGRREVAQWALIIIGKASLYGSKEEAD